MAACVCFLEIYQNCSSHSFKNTPRTYDLKTLFDWFSRISRARYKWIHLAYAGHMTFSDVGCITIDFARSDSALGTQAYAPTQPSIQKSVTTHVTDSQMFVAKLISLSLATSNFQKVFVYQGLYKRWEWKDQICSWVSRAAQSDTILLWEAQELLDFHHWIALDFFRVSVFFSSSPY